MLLFAKGMTRQDCIAYTLTLGVEAVICGCDLSSEPPADIGNTSSALTFSGGPSIHRDAGLERNAAGLYYRLARRLEDRGVSPDRMQAAVDADDAEMVRRLFGYTPAKMDELTAEVRALGERLERSRGGDRNGGGGHAPPGNGDTPPRHQALELDCNLATVGGCFLAGLAGGWKYATSWVGIGYLAVWGLHCMWQGCKVEGGTWLSQP